MIRKLLFSAVLLVSFSILQIGCGSDDDSPPPGPTPVVEPRLVVTAHQDPTLANAIDSPVWDSIDAIQAIVGTENAYNANLLYIGGITVEMKALTADDSLLYIWVSWDDADQSNRFGELRANWTNNLVQWVVNYPEDTIANNEDRFYMIFDKGGPNGADCAAFCHGSGELSSAGHQFYGAAGDNADVWQWKAHRTGLAKLAEDMHMTDTLVAPDPQNLIGDSLYFVNYDVLDGSHVLPKYMHESGIAYTGAGLLESEILNVSGWFEDFNAALQWVIFLPDQPPVGRTVPGYYILDESGTDGSRWNVRAVSEYSGTSWTVVFRRAITTTDAADMDFDIAASDSIEISIGITDNSGIEHYGRKPFYMVFP